MTTVLLEILTWSRARPSWQRDALRRLVLRGELDANDIADLSSLCKSKYGLSGPRQSIPLDAKHLPAQATPQDATTLTSLVHHTGVNALASNQKVTFGPALTVVYGQNASGKSGYTRILKHACRARGAEGILGNVTAGAVPNRPAATIDFSSGRKKHTYAWTEDTTPHPLLSRVSVFDRYCAGVYISKQTDVAYRPLGLDLFDKLSNAAESIRRNLEKERNALQSKHHSIPSVAEGTTVHAILSHLTALTDTEQLKALATLTPDEAKRGKDLRRAISELLSEDPAKTGARIQLRVERATSAAARIGRAAEVLSDDAMKELLETRRKVQETKRAAEGVRAATFGEAVLKGTGSGAWRALWHAGERFSEVEAYPGHDFPVTGPDSRCVLCQQELEDDGMRRLRQFDHFVTSDAEQEYEVTSKEYAKKRERMIGVEVFDEGVMDTLKEIDLEDEEVAAALRTGLEGVEKRRKVVETATVDGTDRHPIVPPMPVVDPTINQYIQRLKTRVQEIRSPGREAKARKLREELKELDARNELGRIYGTVISEIERKKKVAAYQECIRDTNTNSITKKSSELTREVVTGTLTGGFLGEARVMGFEHMEVEMVPTGGKRGVLFHKLQLRRAPNIDIARVMSEGEARCLSIASFFAELRTASDQSAILFDDPVSSLDHKWRGNVVARLVSEAKNRQVVVFTHDIVFLVGLVGEAEEQGVPVTRQNLWKGAAGAGITDERGPWPGMRVKKRIGFLKDELQKAKAMYRREEYFEYERTAEWIYGRLREAWERGLEEVLLEGTVERFRESIQTLPIHRLSDIDEEDCGVLSAGMRKSSTWLPGHDQAAAVNAPIPRPQELEGDIRALEKWVERIRKRRA